MDDASGRFEVEVRRYWFGRFFWRRFGGVSLCSVSVVFRRRLAALRAGLASGGSGYASGRFEVEIRRYWFGRFFWRRFGGGSLGAASVVFRRRLAALRAGLASGGSGYASGRFGVEIRRYWFGRFFGGVSAAFRFARPPSSFADGSRRFAPGLVPTVSATRRNGLDLKSADTGSGVVFGRGATFVLFLKRRSDFASDLPSVPFWFIMRNVGVD